VAVARFDDGQKYVVPTRGYEGDAGLDLYVSRYVPVSPRTRARIPHNLTIALPPGFYGLVVPRSSTLFELGLIVIPGVIDRDFRGEVQTMVYNPNMTTVTVNEGVRISQLLIHKLHQFAPREMAREVLLREYPSVRGEKGFGSTNPTRRKG
jgi:dUTP pyrophosphatase